MSSHGNISGITHERWHQLQIPKKWNAPEKIYRKTIFFRFLYLFIRYWLPIPHRLLA